MQEERRQFENALALNELKARTQLSALSQNYKQNYEKQQNRQKFESIPSTAGSGKPGLGQSLIRLPALTPSQIQECMNFMKYRAQDNRSNGGGFKFEGDRDRALETWDRAYKSNGCDATPERQLQMSQATLLYTRGY